MNKIVTENRSISWEKIYNLLAGQGIYCDRLMWILMNRIEKRRSPEMRNVNIIMK